MTLTSSYQPNSLIFRRLTEGNGACFSASATSLQNLTVWTFEYQSYLCLSLSRTRSCSFLDSAQSPSVSRVELCEMLLRSELMSYKWQLHLQTFTYPSARISSPSEAAAWWRSHVSVLDIRALGESRSLRGLGTCHSSFRFPFMAMGWRSQLIFAVWHFWGAGGSLDR